MTLNSESHFSTILYFVKIKQLDASGSLASAIMLLVTYITICVCTIKEIWICTNKMRKDTLIYGFNSTFNYMFKDLAVLSDNHLNYTMLVGQDESHDKK